jgi:ubiquitin carboxyl-terminal hydrolase 5/13
MHSGETDKVPYIPKAATEQVQLEANIEANSIPPRRFKTLVGKGHPEFSTSHQQDACEFFIHLMQLLERAEHKCGDRMRASAESPPLSSIFKFKLEQRTQCAATGAVSYKHEEQNVLHVDIPLEAATNSQVRPQKHASAGLHEYGHVHLAR